MHHPGLHLLCLMRTPKSVATESCFCDMAKLLRLVRGPRTVREDRLSALSDDLIGLIASKLDTRTALSTAVLSRRWAHIPHQLPALHFRVSDILPPEYDQTVDLRERDMPLDGTIDGLVAHWELRSTRAFADGITNFLAADDGSNGYAYRRVKTKTLGLEFFSTTDERCIDRLIAVAVGGWGVDDLEVIARPASSRHHDGDVAPYWFPHDLLDQGGRSRLRSLTLGNCTLPPLHTYEALTTLVLQDVAASMPVAAYERLFNGCTRLEVLHLKSCGCTEDLDHLMVDAPSSAIRELLVEACAFSKITLRNVPMLARLACLGRTVMLNFGSVPSLTHVNLTFWESKKPYEFLRKPPAATTNLVLRFTGPSRWVLPRHLTTQFRGLKRLLVADLPSNWDVSWPRILLFSAPSLEVLHIHVAHSDEQPGEEIGWWDRKKLRHRHMKELLMIGFTPTPRQILFVKDALSVCRSSLERLVLLRDGHVRYNGLWDWEMARQPECLWSADDEMAVRRLINSASKPLVDVILG